MLTLEKPPGRERVSRARRLRRGAEAGDRRTAPGDYANTIANEVNCLANLPDDPAGPKLGNAGHLRAASVLSQEARQIFAAQGETDKAASVAEALDALETEAPPAVLQ